MNQGVIRWVREMDIVNLIEAALGFIIGCNLINLVHSRRMVELWEKAISSH